MKQTDTPDAPERVTVSMPRALAEAVDDYWHRKRLGSRSEAVRLLLEAALKSEGKRK
jgi:metal-responsive CopG/Arc/MetJ family transcriptional regulator